MPTQKRPVKKHRTGRKNAQPTDTANFLAYHNPDKMGRSVREGDSSIVTDKRVSENAVGSRVWLLTGEDAPRRTFYLCGDFIIDEVGSGKDVGFRTRLHSAGGFLYDKPWPVLNNEKWFEDFKRSQGNFAFGFQRITDHRFIRGLEGAARRGKRQTNS